MVQDEETFSGKLNLEKTMDGKFGAGVELITVYRNVAMFKNGTKDLPKHFILGSLPLQ